MRFLTLVAALLVAVSMAKADFVDNFDGNALNARWTVTNSAGYDVSGGNLNANVGHMWIGDAPLTAFTTAAPTGDFTATMKATFVGSGAGGPQVGIGLFSADQKSFVVETYEYNANEDFLPAGQYGITAKNGTIDPWDLQFHFSSSAVDFGSNAFYLQLTRSGSDYTVSYSADGTSYTPFWSGSYTGSNPLTEVGIELNASDGGTPVAHIDSFTVATPEPATMCLLAVGALGLIRRKRA